MVSFLCLSGDRRVTITTLFKDEVVLIPTWVVTERWRGGKEMAVVYLPDKGVYILI